MIGERLEELRKDKGLKQKQLAKEIGVKSNTISAYEREASRPSDEIKVKLAAYFNVSVDYLLGLIDEEVPYTRDNYVILPKEYPQELKKELLSHLDLLKIKYGLSQTVKKRNKSENNP